MLEAIGRRSNPDPAGRRRTDPGLHPPGGVQPGDGKRPAGPPSPGCSTASRLPRPSWTPWPQDPRRPRGPAVRRAGGGTGRPVAAGHLRRPVPLICRELGLPGPEEPWIYGSISLGPEGRKRLLDRLERLLDAVRTGRFSPCLPRPGRGPLRLHLLPGGAVHEGRMERTPFPHLLPPCWTAFMRNGSTWSGSSSGDRI